MQHVRRGNGMSAMAHRFGTHADVIEHSPTLLLAGAARRAYWRAPSQVLREQEAGDLLLTLAFSFAGTEKQLADISAKVDTVLALLAATHLEPAAGDDSGQRPVVAPAVVRICYIACLHAQLDCVHHNV